MSVFIFLSHWAIRLDLISCHVIAPIPSSAILLTLLSGPVTLALLGFYGILGIFLLDDI